MKNETFCKICGKKTKYGGNTCSRICAGEFKKTNNREERECKVCKNKFIVKKTAKKMLCSDRCRKDWASMPENKEKRIKASQQAVKKKYGVDYTFQMKDFQKKSKQTKKEKYGDENFLNHEKAKQTKRKRYGDENYNNVEKNKKTKRKRYGDENYNNRDKAAQTMLNKHGVEHVMMLEKFKEKAWETNIEKYGYKFATQNDKVKKKTKKTNLKRHGVEYISQNSEIKEKISLSNTIPIQKRKDYLLYLSLKNNNINLIGEFKGTYKKINNKRELINYKFECLKCNSKFKSTFTNRVIPTCRTCFPIYKNNKHQMELSNFLKELGIYFFENDKNIIKPYELDFYIPNNKIAIEINGNYYHSEVKGGKNRTYHINKSKLCNAQGITLIHIFEDELIYKKDIVFSRIKNLLQKNTEKIYARKCEIKEIETKEKRKFLNENHIQGDTGSKIKIALFYKDSIVSLLTLSKKRIALGQKNTKSDEWEIVRFCNKKNTNIIGGFQKMLNYFIKTYSPKKIITFADCRWSGINHNKTIYSKSGFKFINITNPNYWYFEKNNYLKRFHRFNFTKKRLIKITQDIPDTLMSEWDIAKHIGMDRIWDCGNMKFEFSI